ncbi:hypothetical protein BZL42_02105 [Pseudomonas indica]|nr:hypothetical protein BZL42_02105 [Pseudomonas indica]
MVGNIEAVDLNISPGVLTIKILSYSIKTSGEKNKISWTTLTFYLNKIYILFGQEFTFGCHTSSMNMLTKGVQEAKLMM